MMTDEAKQGVVLLSVAFGMGVVFGMVFGVLLLLTIIR